MRRIATMMVPLVLLGCASEPAEDTATTEEVAEEAPAMVTANGAGPGTYEVTAADGTMSTTVLNGDGTYTDSDASGEVIAEGTWEVRGGKTCFTPNTEGAEAECFTETVAASDGSFTATSDNGGSVIVRPVASAEAEVEADVSAGE